MAEVIYNQKISAENDTNLFRIFGVHVDNLTMADAVGWVTADRPSFRCRLGMFVNANSFCNLWQSPQLRLDLNNADRVFADGVGVRLAAKRAGVVLKANVNGTDLFPQVARQMAEQGKSIFLLGGKPGVASDAAAKILQAYPGIRIAGTHHGYFSDVDNLSIIDSINESGADLLLVALGSPLQERWLVAHRDLLDVSCALGVGGLFDFLSQRIPRAPMWIRKLELEWVYRLIQEPKAKGRRYILGNAQFLYRTYLTGELA